jgi:aminoglycoside phosphotransferase (APT) family kinase protein
MPGRSVSPSIDTVDRYIAERCTQFYPKADSGYADDWLAALPSQTDDKLGIRLEDLQTACNAALRALPASITPLATQGTFHRLYRVQAQNNEHFILRIGLPGSQAADGGMLVEARIVEILRYRDFPVCEVLHIDLSRSLCPFDYQLSRAATGQSLAAADNDESQMAKLLTALGEMLARLHAFDLTRGFGFINPNLSSPANNRLIGMIPDWQSYLNCHLDDHIERCRSLNIIDRREADTIIEAFHNPPILNPPSRLLHGDLGNHNIFFANGRISMLIDWEDALAGDPLYDLAFCASFHPEHRHAALFEGYFGVKSRAPDASWRFWHYFLRIAVAKTVLRARFGYQDLPGRMPASQRIQLALHKLGEFQPRRF